MTRLLPAMALCAALLPAPAVACTDTALVLLADISDSMNPSERRLQREGYVAAFGHKDVVGALQSGYCGQIRVAYVEYATEPHMVVPWTTLSDAASADRFARAVLAADHVNLGQGTQGTLTGIANAMREAGRLLEQVDANRKVIDVSSDGPDNVTKDVRAARDELTVPTEANGWREITVNGLPVGQDVPYGMTAEELTQYYCDNIAGGPLNFVIRARNVQDLPELVRRKLVLDLS